MILVHQKMDEVRPLQVLFFVKDYTSSLYSKDHKIINQVASSLEPK
jgi:hypothetical protein